MGGRGRFLKMIRSGGGVGWDRVDRDGKYQQILAKKIYFVFQFFFFFLVKIC